MSALTFDEATHTYRLDGFFIPSASRLIEVGGLKPDFSGIDPAVVERKGQIGKALHAAALLLEAGRLDRSTVDPAVAPYLEAFEAFLGKYGPSLICAEKPDYSPDLLYACTLDRLYLFNAGRAIVDLKTSAQEEPYWGIQTALQAIVEEDRLGRWNVNSPRRYVAHLRPKLKKKFDLIPYTDTLDYEVARGLAHGYHFKVKHGLIPDEAGVSTYARLGAA